MACNVRLYYYDVRVADEITRMIASRLRVSLFLLRATKAPAHPAGLEFALNLANAQGYSVLDVIHAAQRVSGKTIRVEIAPRWTAIRRCWSERRTVRARCSDGGQYARHWTCRLPTRGIGSKRTGVFITGTAFDYSSATMLVNFEEKSCIYKIVF